MMVVVWRGDNTRGKDRGLVVKRSADLTGDVGSSAECERETVTEPRVESGRCRPDVGLSQSPGEARREEEVLGRWDCGNDSEARSTRTPLFSVSLALHLRLTRAHYAVMTLPPSATIDN